MAQPPENTTRQAFVGATARLLEAQGYHGTGLTQIVKESGAPRGSLYYYFPDGKEELAIAAIMQAAQAMATHARAALARHADPIVAITDFFDQIIGTTHSNNFCGGAPLAAVALETASSNSRLREACTSAYALIHAPFAERLVAGGYPLERAHSLATLISAALDGALILSRTQQSAEPVRRVRDEIRLLLECARTPGRAESSFPPASLLHPP